MEISLQRKTMTLRHKESQYIKPVFTRHKVKAQIYKFTRQSSVNYDTSQLIFPSHANIL